ncbi:MAG: HAD family hydrolase [Bradymonadia bacterium]
MSTYTPLIILFDIDGTLVSTGGAGRRAMASALKDYLGQPGALGFHFAGMTDRAILRRAIEGVGATYDERAHDAVVEIYLEHLKVELPQSTNYRVMPGVADFIEACLALPDAVSGLGTGNIEPAARLKLAPAGLDRYFEFGGFGDDAEIRSDMLIAGARRGAAQLGLELSSCEVIVIGDTVRDIHAARAMGARCIAVCTGGDARTDLEAEQPWRVVEDLTEPGLVDRLRS